MSRPTLNQAMKLEAANKTAQNLNHDDVTPEQIAKHYDLHMDGFELAKVLERDCDHDLTFDDVEVLEQMSGYASDVLRNAEKQWVIDNDIQPPLAIGTKTTQGTITGIYQYGAAKYLVKPYGQSDEVCGTKRLVINFENAFAREVAT
ncbi:conserved protein of unknown function [Shewanella benthica]|uniref:Uncharacterized protein n=1 Tax=Shewanella benthica TaxID=43661 RepID=A0A330M4C0_9GAMM|nr:hypothetical protein [Shewanella benthica]SQH76968.1 conserved protein of unknown function [Shewanella benthica]